MPKIVHFGEFLKTWSLRSDSVTRQVIFKRTKIGGKCQNSKHSNATFWVIFKPCDTANFSVLCWRRSKSTRPDDFWVTRPNLKIHFGITFLLTDKLGISTRATSADFRLKTYFWDFQAILEFICSHLPSRKPIRRLRFSLGDFCTFLNSILSWEAAAVVSWEIESFFPCP